MTAALRRHTSWRVYCRTVEGCQNEKGRDYPSPWLCIDRAAARGLAQRHADRTGHAAEVVRVTYETVVAVEPRLRVVGGG